MALTDRQIALLDRLNLPTDFSNLTDDQYFKIDDVLSSEYQRHGINAAGNGLNDYGELCVSIITALPDD